MLYWMSPFPTRPSDESGDNRHIGRVGTHEGERMELCHENIIVRSFEGAT